MDVIYGDIEVTDAVKKHAALKDEEFHKEYSTFSEALEHSDKIIDSYLYLKGTVTFYVDDNGQLIKVEENEKKSEIDRDKYATYKVTFNVKDQKVTDIIFNYHMSFNEANKNK